MLGAAGTASAAAQTPALHVRVGVAGSSALAEDLVASALLRQNIGAPVAASVSARPRPAPTLEVAAGLAVRPRVEAEFGLGYARTTLRAEEAGGAAWDAGDLGLLQGILSLRWQWRPGLALSGGFGALRYLGGGDAFFAGGGELNPAVQAAAELRLPWVGGRGGVRVFAQGHRFNTPALRRAGSSDGTVLRLGIQGTVRVLEGGRP